MQFPSACLRHFALGTASLLLAATAQAGTGKLALTGGVSTIEGAAGGGISPWALIGTQATEGEMGVGAYVSRASTQDYSLNAMGIKFGWDDRLELSVGRQDFDTGPTGVALGLPGLRLKQDIFGAKVRVAGDAILDSDRSMPQIAVGMQHKRLDAGGLAPTLSALGADRVGTDLYISAAKLFLSRGVLVNGTLRATRANQGGLLGFGSSRSDSYRLQPEIGVALLLRRNLAVGFEYRAKPDNLNHILGAGVLREDDWKDLFIAWAPTPNVSLTAAWVDLGQIAPPFVTRRQSGWYLSAQVAF